LRGKKAAVDILTVGHSTRAIEEFIGLLRENGISLLVDVRTVPGSRRNPQYNREELERSLGEAGIGYRHMKGLGGLRRALGDSPNTGWRNPSFRGFADYMGTEEFRESLATLVDLAAQRRTAIMCAEALPWRCHRSLIGDALLARGVRVFHIMGKGPLKEHRLTAFARVRGGEVNYPAGAGGAGAAGANSRQSP
jgi:uncharacterized protein (DUF488 family)